MRCLVIYAHPVETSYCAALCAKAVDTLKSARHEVRVLDLYAEGFDPSLSRQERLDYRDFTGKPTEELIQSLAGHYSRVWVVLMSNGDPGHPDATTLMLNSLFGKSFPRMEHSWFPKIEVRLYSGTWPPEAR